MAASSALTLMPSSRDSFLKRPASARAKYLVERLARKMDGRREPVIARRG